MKKISKRGFAALLSMLILAAALTGCGGFDPAADTVSEFGEKVDSAVNGGEATVGNNNAGEAEVSDNGGNSGSGVFNAQNIVDTLGIDSYTCFNDYSNTLVMVLKNNSEYKCKLSLSVDFYDENDNIVDTKDSYVEVSCPGTENAMYFYTDDKFATYKYEIKASEYESDYYYGVNDQLSCEVSTATDKAIISATNNGEKTAEYVEYTALFFKNDKLVYVGWGFIGDDDSEIKPGRTEKISTSCYEDFDSVKVYLDGYGYNY